MGFKFIVDRLSRTELQYESKRRGLPSDKTVTKLRENLRQAMAKEASGVTPTYPAYPFTFIEDFDAVNALKEELTQLIAQHTATPDKNIAQSIETKFSFALGRVDNSVPDSEDEKLQKETLFTDLAVMMSRYELSTKRLNVHELLTLRHDAAQSFDPNVSTSSSATPIDVPPTTNVTVTTTVTSTVTSPTAIRSNISTAQYKPVPVSKWNLHFSAESRGLSLSAFLERVNELKRARNVTDDRLFEESCDLFTGKALLWFRANVSLVRTWDELVRLLRLEFQPVDYDDRLLEEIKRRTQGAEESIGMYVAIMKNMFSRLATPLNENNILRILLRNISPFYQTQLGLVEVKSIADLIAYGRKIEERRSAVENYVPPSRKKGDLEADLAYVEAAPSTPNVVHEISTATFTPRPAHSEPRRRPMSSSPLKCWNCGDTNHRAGQCPKPRSKIYCYRCGKPEVTVNTCPKCGKSNNQNQRFSGNDSRRH